MQALSSDAVSVKVASLGVGPISAHDVQLAGQIGARVLGFNVRTAVCTPCTDPMLHT